MKLTARPILRRFGFRIVIIVNGVISTATIIMCAFFTGARRFRRSSRYC